MILTILGAQVPEDWILHRSSTLKIYETQHLRVFHTAEYLKPVRVLGQHGETFLAQLERDWGIVLPKTPFSVSLIRVKPRRLWIDHDFDPPWLASTYNRQNSRIELRAKPSGFELAPAIKALKHHLVHALLNLEQAQPLPTFLEEGLARYYAGSRGSRQVYWTILGFQRADHLPPFLENPFTYQIELDYQYAGAIGFHLIPWMWAKQPHAEKAFLQGHLRGASLQQALGDAGLPPMDKLLVAFDSEMRPTFGLGRLLKTFDFWLLIFAVSAVIAILFKLIAAFRHARMDFLEVAAQPELVPSELFQGPVFQPVPLVETAEKASSGLPPLPQVPKMQTLNPSSLDEIALPPMGNIFQHVETVNSGGAIHQDTGEFKNLEDQLEAVFDRISPLETPPVPETRAKSLPIDPREADQRSKSPDKTGKEIEADVDQFFNQLSQEEDK